MFIVQNFSIMARCNAKLQVELESAQGAQFTQVPNHAKMQRPLFLCDSSAKELEAMRQMFPPLVQEAAKLLIECYRFEDRLMDVARLVFDRLEDANPEEGPDEYTMRYYNESLRPHIDAIHKEIVRVLENKLEDNAMNVVF